MDRARKAETTKASEKAGLTGKRAEAYDHLWAVARLYLEAGEEDAQEEVYDLMDRICNWCGSHYRVTFADEKDEASMRPDKEGESDG